MLRLKALKKDIEAGEGTLRAIEYAAALLKGELAHKRRKVVELVEELGIDKTGWLANILERASQEVDSWSPQRRAAFEQRTGVKLPK